MTLRRRLILLGDGAALVTSIAAAICLMVAVVAGFWQVVTRFVLSDPAIWSEALVRLALIWTVMLGFAVALRDGALVSIDALGKLVSPRFQTWLARASVTGIAGFCLILGWFGVTMARRVTAQEMAGLEISIAWGYAAIPVGCGFGLICALSGFLAHRHTELEAEI